MSMESAGNTELRPDDKDQSVLVSINLEDLTTAAKPVEERDLTGQGMVRSGVETKVKVGSLENQGMLRHGVEVKVSKE